MASADVQQPVDPPSTNEPAPAALPDYLTDPDAVQKDTKAAWRYGAPPDYTNTRKVWAESKPIPPRATSVSSYLQLYSEANEP